jgi:hypothetical protein
MTDQLCLLIVPVSEVPGPPVDLPGQTDLLQKLTNRRYQGAVTVEGDIIQPLRIKEGSMQAANRGV